MRTWQALVGVVVGATVAAGCGGGPAEPAPHVQGGSRYVHAKALPWDRPDNQQAQVKAAGLSLSPQEMLNVHYHAHLDVFVKGKPVTVPAGLGINIGPNNTMPAHGEPGIAPLHTHDTTGVLHIEAPRDDTFTLGQAFAEWGVLLSPRQVGAYRDVRVFVDGKRYGGNPANLVLQKHQEIAVVAGSGDVKVPSSYDFPPGE
jgi:hypothetical protein